jgi:hypothetical protein
MADSGSVVGLLHPGEMGASVGAALAAGSGTALWAGAGRSEQSAQRAQRAGLTDAGTVGELVPRCAAVVSVCPPHAALDVARQVVSAGGVSLYVEGNAVAPDTVQRIAELMPPGTVVDGSLVGPPAWAAGTTALLLSGPRAQEAAALFEGSNLDVRVIGDRIGQASMAKVCFALTTKALGAIWAAAGEAADAYGVRDDLAWLLARGGVDLDKEIETRERGSGPKAWRFVGEMHEAAHALNAAGMPDGFSLAAAEVYRRMAERLGGAQSADA